MTKPEINLINTWEVAIEDATPAMQKFLEIKKEHNDTLLLYRMGDFYETFFEDAVILSRELELTLTGRECGSLGRIPLAGIPVKALDNYLEKLIAREIKVAICEQLEDPKTVKGIGPKTARLIVDEFGDRTFYVLANAPEELCKIRGITREKAMEPIMGP